MKQFIIFIALLFACTSAFAMASKPDYNTKQGCYQKPYTECGSYMEVVQAGSEANKCANEIWDECRCKWNGQEYANQYNVDPDCSRFE